MKISFIGHGNMAQAMIKGILKSDIMTEEDILTTDLGDDNQTAVDFADYIFLTIKPQVYQEVLSTLNFSPNKLFITVAPGIKTSSINAKVILTMPNTPALLGCGVTAVCRNDRVTDEEYAFIKSLLATFSTVYEFEESQMDDIVALSGSSPAYTYMFIDAIASYSASRGINYDTALTMAAQTVIGAAQMILKTGDSPLVLRDKVCSKGGTTIKAVEVLETKDFYAIISQAMAACEKRAKELAQD